MVREVPVNILPDAFHIIPVSYNAMFHGVTNAEQATVFLSLRTHKQITLKGSSHDTHMFRSPNAK